MYGEYLVRCANTLVRESHKGIDSRFGASVTSERHDMRAYQAGDSRRAPQFRWVDRSHRTVLFMIRRIAFPPCRGPEPVTPRRGSVPCVRLPSAPLPARIAKANRRARQNRPGRPRRRRIPPRVVVSWTTSRARPGRRVPPPSAEAFHHFGGAARGRRPCLTCARTAHVKPTQCTPNRAVPPAIRASTIRGNERRSRHTPGRSRWLKRASKGPVKDSPLHTLQPARRRC